MKKHTAIERAALETRRVDTHGHLHGQIPSLEGQAVAPADLDRLENPYNARSIAEGCEALYGAKLGPVLRTDTPRAVFEQAAALRALGRQAAYAKAFEAAGIENQFCFCDWRGSDAKDKRAIAPHVRLLAYIDQALLGTPAQGESYLQGLERLHGRLKNLDELLGIVDRAVDAWPAMGVVGMKVSLAYYGHGLALRQASRAEADAAFGRRERMSVEETRIVRDFALLHAFDACRRNGLPVVFHTGFLAFGEAPICGANPANLEPVLWDERFVDVTFVLLHGGYPYTGETGYLAARHPNVVIDFTWISWMCPARFRQALGEWLALAPLTRFVWGADSGPAPESIVGTDRISRRAIAEVLEDQVRSRVLDEPRALRFVELAFRENARRLFRLG